MDRRLASLQEMAVVVPMKMDALIASSAVENYRATRHRPSVMIVVKRWSIWILRNVNTVIICGIKKGVKMSNVKEGNKTFLVRGSVDFEVEVSDVESEAEALRIVETMEGKISPWAQSHSDVTEFELEVEESFEQE
jgi:hypothetical protein